MEVVIDAVFGYRSQANPLHGFLQDLGHVEYRIVPEPKTGTTRVVFLSDDDEAQATANKLQGKLESKCAINYVLEREPRTMIMTPEDKTWQRRNKYL